MNLSVPIPVMKISLTFLGTNKKRRHTRLFLVKYIVDTQKQPIILTSSHTFRSVLNSKSDWITSH